MPHIDHHFSQRSPFIRAAVLGGNDGIISMSGVLMAVSSASASLEQINLTVFSAFLTASRRLLHSSSPKPKSGLLLGRSFALEES